MSEHPPDYQTAPDQPVDPHTALYNQVYSGIQTNHMLFDELMSRAVPLLPGAQPQAAEDALHNACVSLGKVPLDSLLLIHEFLRNYHRIMQREQAQPEPFVQPDSPFLGREEE